MPTLSPKVDPTTATTSALPRFLRHLIFLLLLLLPLRHLFSLVALKDLYLSLSLQLLSDLTPASVHLSNYNSTLHFWVPTNRSQQSTPPSSKPSLLLIHGFGGNARWQFSHQIPALSRSFDLYIPDLLFFGSSATSSPLRSVEFQSRCLIESMRRFGVERYSIVGISYGGYVAYKMAAEMAGEWEVERVVVMTAGVCMEEEERKVMAERERIFEILLPEKAEDLMELMRRSMHRPPKWVPEFLLADFIQVMYKERRKERVELLKDLLANGIGKDPPPVLKQAILSDFYRTGKNLNLVQRGLKQEIVTTRDQSYTLVMETLILWGDKDEVFPISLAYRLQRHLGAKSRLEVIEGAGHALPLEKPDVVNRMIEWFVSEPYRNVSL